MGLVNFFILFDAIHQECNLYNLSLRYISTFIFGEGWQK